MSINVPWVMEELRSTLGRLAAQAPIQLEQLAQIGQVAIDELALDFDAVSRVAPTLADDGVITIEQAAAIHHVEEQLQRMSGEDHGALWTEEALRHSTEWRAVRDLATRALDLLLEAK